MKITTENGGNRVREHRGYGHGLRPGEDRDLNCPSCKAEDNWAVQLQRQTRGFCPDPAAHKLHTDGRWLYETCPHCGYDEALVACTGCEKLTAERIPWSGERLCWDCTDLQLDLLAKALEDEPVQVGGFGLR